MEALIFPAILFIVMYVVLIRPQQKRQRETTELLNSLAVGDEVVLNSGIHGFINTIEDNIIWLEVAAGLELKVARSAVGHRVVEADEPADSGSSNDTDFIDSDS